MSEALRPSRPGARDIPPWLERLVTLTDDAVRIPGTQIRVGLDAILGFVIPGLGDATGAVIALGVLLQAVRAGLPRSVVLGMLLRVAVDAVVGTLPIVGDLFDVTYKANRRNLEILRAHQARGKPPSSGPDIALVLLIFVVVVLALGISMALMWALVRLLD